MYALTGTYAPADLSPASGTVEITPDIVNVAGNVVIVQQPVVATLDDLGAIAVEVVASDDPSWRLEAGQKMPYIVRENVTGLRRAWMTYMDGTGGDISDLVPLDVAPDLGSDYLTKAEADAQYERLERKDQASGYVGLDMTGRIDRATLNSPMITGTATVPDYPVNTVGDMPATLDYVVNTVVNYIQQHNLLAHRAFSRNNAGVPSIPDTWTEVGYLSVAAHEQGTWIFTMAMVWEFDSTNRSALFRISQDNGATWGDTFSVEPNDATDVYTFSYVVPRLSQGNASTVRVQASKEAGSGGTLATRSCDLSFFRVA